MKSQVTAKFTDEVENASVSFWYVKEGDVIEEGSPLVEFVTEKASFTYESPASGKIVRILAPEGAETANGSLIAEIEIP